MIIPIRSDTRKDYFPFVTIALIVLNVMVFVLAGPPWGEDSTVTNYFILNYQGGLHPIQWVLSAFAHSDIFHIGVNMIFLWAFGMIIEGDVGHIRFTAIYLISIVAAGLIEQLIFYNIEGGSLGASSAIFSLMMISLLWVPHNEIECIYFIWLRPDFASIKIQWFAAIYFVIDLADALINSYGSGFLHIIGGIVGLVIGFVFLLKKWVDPEGWDFISIYFKKEKKATSLKNPDTKAFQIKYQVVPVINKSILAKNVDEAIFLYDSNIGFQNVKNFDRIGFSKLLYEKGEYQKLIEFSEQIDTIYLRDYHSTQLLAAKAVKESMQNELLFNKIFQRINPTYLPYSDEIIYKELTKLSTQKVSNTDDPFTLENL